MSSSRPPDEMVRLAVTEARRSPCAKSKRGAVMFLQYGPDDDAHCDAMSMGHNGPPAGYSCDSSDACRRDCVRRCVHAEMRALRRAATFDISIKAIHLLHLVHVKVGALGELVAGGPPSCEMCSREILDVGIGAVWLYQFAWRLVPVLQIGRSGGVKPTIEQITDEDDSAFHLPEWQRYTAAEFHAHTLINTGVHAC